MEFSHFTGDSSAWARAGRGVLVVDDVAETRGGLAELLRLKGFDAHEAGNGAEALDILTQRSGICVVVLDLQMPGTDGFWFREHQRQNPDVANVPVIVFTGSVSGEALGHLAVNEVLLKPFSVDALLRAIDRVCA